MGKGGGNAAGGDDNPLGGECVSLPVCNYDMCITNKM